MKLVRGNGTQVTDRQGWARAQLPNSATPLDFETVYRDHADYVYNLAFRLSGAEAEADDLMQETFMRVYRYLSGYAGGSLRAWLRRIVINLFLTKCKAQSRQNHLSIDQTDEEGRPRKMDDALLDSSGDPGFLVEQVSLDDRVQSSLDALPADFRLALVLREIEDLSYEQIATVLGVPIGTVRSRLARGRAMLREHLGECG